MKRVFVIVAMVMVILATVLLMSCKAKAEKDKLPDEATQKQITTFAPLPSFKEVFKTIDIFAIKDIEAATKDPIYKTKQEVPRNSYALGVLTAEAIIASRAKNKKRMIELSSEMMKLTTIIGLESEFNRLGDDIKTMIEKENWSELEQALDSLKREVEDKLWDTGEFDNYTLMLFGGWTQALNRMSFILNRNYETEKSKILNQKGTWNSLIGNLNSIDKDYLINEPYFVQAKATTAEIKAILDADVNGTFTKEQVEGLIKLTEKIKTAMQQ